MSLGTSDPSAHPEHGELLEQPAMSIKNYPSIDFVCQCLRYEDGKLFWLERPKNHFKDEHAWNTWNTRFSGIEAGYQRKADGRTYIKIKERDLARYEIVFALHHGRWANGVDHKDRDPCNDVTDNLREASQGQNNANQSLSSKNRTGFKGVSWDSTKMKWYASISISNKTIALGRFNSPEEAHKAYMKAARRFWGEFASNGKE